MKYAMGGQDIDKYGGWEFAFYCDADECFANMPGILGLFFESWCIAGILIRPAGYSAAHGWPNYYAEYGLIILNCFLGIWWDEDKEQK